MDLTLFASKNVYVSMSYMGSMQRSLGPGIILAFCLECCEKYFSFLWLYFMHYVIPMFLSLTAKAAFPPAPIRTVASVLWGVGMSPFAVAPGWPATFIYIAGNVFRMGHWL